MEKRREALLAVYKRLKFEPTEAQWPPLLCDAREILVSGGEQGGKSLLASKYLTGRIFEEAYEGAVYWIAAQDYERCGQEFLYLLEDMQTLNPKMSRKDWSYHERDQCSMSLLGGKIKVVTKSLSDITKIAMEAPNGIVVCEVFTISYAAWLRLGARTARSRGWLLGTGTFEGSLGWGPEMWEYFQSPAVEGMSFSMPSWSNTYYYPGGREDPEIKRQEAKLDPDLFMERFAAVPCKPTGLVIKDFSNLVHVGEYEFDVNLPVEIGVDPGIGVYAVGIFQERDGQIVMIDEIYWEGHTAKEIIHHCKQQAWWKNLLGGAGDVAAKESLLAWEGAGVHLRAKKVPIEAGIDLLRTYLKPNPISNKPLLVVDYRCRGFIAECGGGPNPVEGAGPWLRDKYTGKPMLKDDHACKEAIYLLANKFGFRGDSKIMRKIPTRQF